MSFRNKAKKRTSSGRGSRQSFKHAPNHSLHKGATGESACAPINRNIFELEVLDGLGPVSLQELKALIGHQGKIIAANRDDQITFEYSGRRQKLFGLRTAVAVFQLVYFKVPHPLSIIHGANLEHLVSAIDSICHGGEFSSFRVGAAGSNSTAFKKIKSVISERTGLSNDEKNGEMSIRFRRSRIKPFGWDVLIRLTPLPLSARVWRMENMPGALNATIAAAMVLETEPKPNDRFLNLMCGSGTILAERAAVAPAQVLIGVDISEAALEKARTNLRHLKISPTLLKEDASQLSLSDGSVDVVCSDLPWGRLIGKDADLSTLYFNAIGEAARVCVPGGWMAVLTQEVELFENVLKQYRIQWNLVAKFRVKQSEYKPKFYLLHRSNKR